MYSCGYCCMSVLLLFAFCYCVYLYKGYCINVLIYLRIYLRIFLRNLDLSSNFVFLFNLFCVLLIFLFIVAFEFHFHRVNRIAPVEQWTYSLCKFVQRGKVSIMYLKLNHDNSTSTTFELIDLPEESGAWLRSVYDHLNIDILDVVPSVIPGLFLVIDDMGKMYYGWEDRINSAASILYGSLGLGVDSIVGDVIVCRRIGPELVPLTFQDISYLEKFFNARFLKQTDRDREATFGG